MVRLGYHRHALVSAMFTPIKPPDPDQERIDRLITQQAESSLRHQEDKAVAVTRPALQAAIIALPVSLLALLVWIGFELPRAELFTPGVFLVVFVVVFWWFVVDWLDMRWAIESALHVDLNGDGQVGGLYTSTPAGRRIKVDYTERPGHSKVIDLHGTESDILAWLRALANGESVSEERWANQLRRFTQDEIAHNRAELIGKEFARWKNPDAPKLGIEATDSGLVWIERTLAQHSPSLTGD